MNDKDASLARTVVANVQEVNMVLSECHDGVIAIRESWFLDKVPPDSC